MKRFLLGVVIVALTMLTFGVYKGSGSITDKLIIVLIFSVSISLLITLFHYLSMYFKGYKFSEKADKIIPGELNQLKRALELQKGWEVAEDYGTSIRYRVGNDLFLSYEELVTIEQIEDAKLRIQSVSKNKIALYDYGKNLDNLKLIAELMELD